MATSPGFNPGMLLSELTAAAMLRRVAPVAEICYFRFLPLEERLGHLDATRRAETIRRCDVGIAFSRLDSSAQLSGTTPLYWGDFLHMRQYVNAVSRLLTASGRQASAEDLLLLHGASEDVRSSSISLSTTLIFNTGSDLADPGYGAQLKRFAEQSKLVLARDIVSASQLTTVTGGNRQGFLGIDATQFITLFDDWRDAFSGEVGPARSGDGRGLVFFARGRHEPQPLAAILRGLKASLGIALGWIPWGDETSFPYLAVGGGGGAGLRPAEKETPPRLEGLIADVAAAKVIITDTYHLAVIGWSLGVPVIMVPGSYWPDERDVNAGFWAARIDKRYVFYAQHNLLEFYLSPDIAGDPDRCAQAVEMMARSVSAGHVARQHRETVRGRASAAEEKLRAALGS